MTVLFFESLIEEKKNILSTWSPTIEAEEEHSIVMSICLSSSYGRRKEKGRKNNLAITEGWLSMLPK